LSPHPELVEGWAARWEAELKPRITFSLTPDGSLEMFFNEEGRQLFIQELSRLTERNDHFHFAPATLDSEVTVSSRAYNPEDRVLDYGKVLFRPDAWDKQYYPHVIDEPN
jgi:hypothetical protein